MEQTLFSRKQLAERWGYPSTKPIETLETKGVLKRVPNFDGVRYSIIPVRKKKAREKNRTIRKRKREFI